MTRRPIFSDKRRNPSVWVDPRLVIGVLLITASVIGVYVIISMNDHRIPVYVARVPLSVGETVNPQDLITLSIAFDGASEHYLVPGKPLDEDLVVRRAVGVGELLPRAAVGAASGARFTSIVLELSSPRPASVVDGAIVDVWSSAITDDRRFAAPGVIVGGASVVRVVSGDSLVTPHGGESVEVLVPTSKVAIVLEAIANGDALSVIPAVTAHTTGQ